MRKSAFLLTMALALLAGCVTINVYFPAAAAQKAADKIIGNIIGPESSAPASFAPAPALMDEIRRHADAMHPYRDGHSSERVIAATEALLRGSLGALAPKPLMARVRSLQIRKALGYWGPAA